MLTTYLVCLLAGAVLISLSLDNDGGVDGEAGNLSLLFSTPFWSFGLTGFGLCGVLMLVLSPPPMVNPADVMRLRVVAVILTSLLTPTPMVRADFV